VRAAQGQAQQQLLAQHRELLSQPTQSPAPYLTRAVDGFLEQLTVLYQTKQELAAVAPPEGVAGGAPVATGGLQSLPDVLRSMHEFLIQVAARVARVQDGTKRMRQAHLQVRFPPAHPYRCSHANALLARTHQRMRRRTSATVLARRAPLQQVPPCLDGELTNGRTRRRRGKLRATTLTPLLMRTVARRVRTLTHQAGAEAVAAAAVALTRALEGVGATCLRARVACAWHRAQRRCWRCRRPTAPGAVTSARRMVKGGQASSGVSSHSIGQSCETKRLRAWQLLPVRAASGPASHASAKLAVAIYLREVQHSVLKLAMQALILQHGQRA
jgi:hypothetical protein